MESAQPRSVEADERIESPQRTAVDMRQRNAILLIPPGEKLPEGWQAPWIKAGWSVSNCGNPERIPAALHGPGASALVVSPWAEVGKPALSGTVARGLTGVVAALGTADDSRRDTAAAVGGMVRRADFLAHLRRMQKCAEGSSCCALMAIQVDQASALNGELSRTAIFDLEERICSRFASVLEKRDITTIWLEFGFGILVQRADSESVWALAEKLRGSIAEKPFLVGAESKSLTVSIGLSLSPRAEGTDCAHQWFASAHAAQGIAHRRDGNRCEGLLTREFEPMPAERVLIIREWVREAKAGTNVVVEYQPLMPMNSAAVELYSVHAKLRDYRAPLGGVYRNEYLRLARDAGAMVMIDRMSLFHAFETLEQEHARGRATQLMVPIELETLKDLPWRWFEAELQRRQHLLDRLIVELDAVAGLLDKDSVMRLVRLRRFGVRIGLADRSADLRHVPDWSKLPADVLTLQHAAANALSPDEFRAAVQAWQSKQRLVVVDAVEDANALVHLQGLGVDHLRGQALAAIGPRLDYDFSAAA